MSCPVCQGYDSHKCPCCSPGARTIECPTCHGKGITPWLAMHLETKEIISITHAAWLILPEDETEAEQMTLMGRKQYFIQYEEGGDICPTCRGDRVLFED